MQSPVLRHTRLSHCYTPGRDDLRAVPRTDVLVIARISLGKDRAQAATRLLCCTVRRAHHPYTEGWEHLATSTSAAIGKKRRKGTCRGTEMYGGARRHTTSPSVTS
ncbi:hypothetical protein E2C01_011914 [Portunus trituberculatus]|uniref:Uncharacterized protein n=1 Tax=Portunus trituberculatus TaxID=210409 RepID=A0A5B7DCC0_PORTR|nr:hypothetical protein [Portunus trituberculatus]